MGGAELGLVQEAFASNWIAPLGPMVDAFELEAAAAAGRKGGAALVSGTSTIHLALKYLGVGRSDHVLCSTLTFSGSCNPILYEGAVPVFIDSEPETWNMDPLKLEQAICELKAQGIRCKAAIVVDLYGQSADYGRIVPILEREGIPLIEDSAEALGAKCSGKPCGSFGMMGILSFNGNKIITTSGGGMLVADDEAILKKARFWATQSRDPAPWYEHSEVGYNYRMSNVAAAIGRGQLQVLDNRVGRKREIFDAYRNLLGNTPGISFMPEPSWSRSNRWLTVILIDPAKFGTDTHAVREALEAENIEARPVWKPMHLQKVFRAQGAGLRGQRSEIGGQGSGIKIQDGETMAGRTSNIEHATSNDEQCSRRSLADNHQPPTINYPALSFGGAVAEELFAKGLCLPSGTAMTEADVERVAGIVKRAGGG
jgi:pyridoxal phosphate-dependent aminotransferase EpsN